MTSTSNTTGYQSRRLKIRYRKEGGRPQLLHTLNGTALVISRALISKEALQISVVVIVGLSVLYTLPGAPYSRTSPSVRRAGTAPPSRTLYLPLVE